MFSLMYQQQRRKLRRYKGSGKPLLVLFKWWAALMVCSLGMTIAFKACEGAGWSDSLFHGWQTVTTVGYGNHAPSSFWGRFFTIVFGTLSIILFAPTFGAYLTYIDDLKQRKRRGMTENVHPNGVVIFNFPGAMRLQRFIEEQRASDPKTRFCVVDSQLEELPEEFTQNGVHFVRGEVIDDETFQRANVDAARAVAVFPRDINLRESDQLTAFTVSRLTEFMGKDTRCIHILVDPKNQHLFSDSPSTPIYNGLSLLAVVQEINDPGTALGIERLLLNTEGEDPHTVVPSERFYAARVTWEKLTICGMHAARAMDQAMNFQAIIRNGVPNYCPDLDAVIEPGDRLSIVMRHRAELDWPRTEREILRYC